MAFLCRNATAIYLATLTGLAFCLNFFAWHHSLWYDEMATWRLVSLGGPWAITYGLYSLGEPFPPLYFWLVGFCRFFLGDAEWVLRLPSALAGALSLPMLYLLGTRLSSRTTGLCAATLGIFAWSRLYFSIDARPYELLFLVSSVFLYFLAGLTVRPPPGKRDLLWLVLSGTALCYLHFFGLVLVACAGLFCLLFYRQRFLPFLWMALAYLPWLPITLYHLRYAPVNQNIKVKSVLEIYSRFMRFLLLPPEWLPGFGFKFLDLFTFYFLPAFLLYFLVNGFRKRRLNPADGLVLWCLIMPFVLVALKGVLSTPVFRPKYLIICAPAFLVLVAHSFSLLNKKYLGFTLTGILVAMMVQTNLLQTPFLTSTLGREARGGAHWLIEEMKKNPARNLVICSFSSGMVKYYFRDEPLILAKWPTDWDCTPSALDERLAQLPKGEALVWLFPSASGVDEKRLGLKVLAEKRHPDGVALLVRKR